MFVSIPHHEYKEEVLHYAIKFIPKWFIFSDAVIYPDKVGCLCSKPKEDRIHKPVRVDQW